jgi:hypothetical protein
MKNETRPAGSSATHAQEDGPPRPRFIDPREARRVPLGNLKTDEEARLAAEIEKLRG